MEPVVTACDGRGEAVRIRPDGRSTLRSHSASRGAAGTGMRSRRGAWWLPPALAGALAGLAALAVIGSMGSGKDSRAATGRDADLPGAVQAVAEAGASAAAHARLAPAVTTVQPQVPAMLPPPAPVAALRRPAGEPGADAPPPPPPRPEATPSAVHAAIATPSSLPAAHAAVVEDGRRFLVRDESGTPVVARLHGEFEGRSVLILPDGQLGVPGQLVPTPEPFRPLTAEELKAQLRRGPLAQFEVLQSAHYLVFYKSSRDFAETSARVLEDLYGRLLETFRKHEMPVVEAEFPLVAVIHASEREFRASHDVDPEVQAFYEIYSNRIYFYESSDRDGQAPEVAALRKPQTVAHEGTHQILQNIGIQPRLSAWPIWLVEGLAEYCASPALPRKGAKPTWEGLGLINSLHMATLRELDDPLSVDLPGQDAAPREPIREPGKTLVESMLRKKRLTPTEYAPAWAMVHYLASKRQDDFVAYLRTMSELPPLVPRTPEEQVAVFREAFGADIVKLDKAIDVYLRKLSKQKGFDPMPFYAVVYEQHLPTGLLRRAVKVSQSPQMIQQWLKETTDPQGAPPSWQAFPHPTYARAVLAARQWIKEGS